MANHDIKIVASKPNYRRPFHSELTLEPGDNTVVKEGDTVTWKVEVPEITAIMISKDSDIDVFNPDPAPIQGSKNWSGTIQKNLKKGATEKYSIYWSQGGVVYAFDPKISVNN